MIFPEFTPEVHIDAYLNKPYNFDIYNQFRYLAKVDPENSRLTPETDMLAFFNLLYEQFEIVKANKNKPLSLKEHLLNLDIESEGIKDFFLAQLSSLVYKEGSINKYQVSDSQLDICYKIIQEIYFEKETDIDFEGYKALDEYTFAYLKRDLEDIPNIKDKIKYLLQEKARALNDTIYLSINPYAKTVTTKEVIDAFKNQCAIELEKLQGLLEVEGGEQIRDNDVPGTSLNITSEYTNSQLVLIFYYFLKSCGIEPRKGDVAIASIAKFLHLITGKNFSAVANSDFYKKLQNVPNFKNNKELIKDLEAIKPAFQAVQLIEIVKMIDNEIDIAKSEIKLLKQVF